MNATTDASNRVGARHPLDPDRMIRRARENAQQYQWFVIYCDLSTPPPSTKALI